MNMDKNIQEIPIEDIIPNRFQPRLSFNEEGINELSESIKQHGIIQPLVVRKLGDKFEIIAGERRYKAATLAGLTKVPVIISDIDDNQSAEVALVENIQRRNLTAIEEAKSYKNLLDRGYLTQEQLANKMGVSQSSIANKLRLLNLDEEVQDALLNERISERHARALLCLEDKDEQKKWLKRILEERMTVRQLDIELKKLQGNAGFDEESIPLVDINPNIEDIVNKAEDIHVEREPHDVASMLVPEGGKKEEPKEEVIPSKMPNKFFNFLEDEQANMSVVEPDEIMNTFNQEVAPIEKMKEVEAPAIENTPVIEESPIVNVKPITPVEPTILPQEEQNPTPSTSNETVEVLGLDEEKEDEFDLTSFMNKIEEKTFEEEPKMTPIEETVIESSTLPQEPIMSNENPIMEEVAEPTINTPINNEIETNPIEQPEPISNSIIEESPIAEEIQPMNTENSPFKSIFFNQEEDDTTSTPMNISPTIENSIEEVTPVVEEKLVDPMDSVVTLEPDYEQKQQELAGTDLKTAINVIRDTVCDLEKRGFTLEMEEADLEELYHITIKITKN